MISTAFFSTTCWLIATFITKPVDEEKLTAFYNKVKPRSPGWKKIAGNQLIKGSWTDILNWILGTIMIYSILFAIGKIILRFYISGLIFAVVAVICGLIIFRDLSKRGWETAGN